MPWSEEWYRAWCLGQRPLTRPATHAQVQNAVRAVARQYGLLHFHVAKPRTVEEAGWPDSTLVHPAGGTLYMVEIKVGDDTLTPGQQRWLAALQRVTRIDACELREADLAAWQQRLAALLKGDRR